MIGALLDPSRYAFNPYAIPTFLTMVAILLLGVVAVLYERRSVVNVLFFWMTVTIGIWLFAFSWMYCATDERVALLWAKIAYLGVPFIPAGIYHFTTAFLRIQQARSALVWAGWALAVFFSAAILSTNTLVSGLYRYWWGFYPRYGWLSVPYLTFFFIMTVLTLREYWVAYRQSLPGTAHRLRIRALFGAFCIVYVACVDYIAKYGIPFYPFGYLPVLAFVWLTLRAIIRYHLFDITPEVAAQPILERMGEAVLVLDLEGTIRLVNRSACELFGLSEGTLKGQPVARFLDHPVFAERLDAAFQEGKSQHYYEVPYVRTPLDMRTFSVSLSVVLNPAKQPTAVVCFVRDITAHKHAEEVLSRVVGQRRSANAPTPPLEEPLAGLSDRVGRQTPSAQASWWFGSRWRLIIVWLLTLCVPVAFMTWFEATGVVSVRLGSVLLILVLGYVWLNVMRRQSQTLVELNAMKEQYVGKLQRALAERQLAEQALRQSLERYYRLARRSPVGIFHADPQGRCLYVNERWCQIAGLSQEEALGEGWSGALHPEDRNTVMQEWTVATGQQRPFELEYRFRRPDGTVTYVFGQAAPDQDEASEVLGYVGTVTDISERKRADEQLQRAHAQLKKSHEALKATQLQLIRAAKLESLGRLAAGVAHEVKNPLAIILTGVNYLSHHLPTYDDRTTTVFHDVKDAVKRADTIIKGMLDFSAPKELTLCPEDLNAVVERSLLLLKHEMDRAHITLVRLLGDGLPKVQLDADKIEQVFVNILMNAIQAMPRGGTLTVKTYATQYASLLTNGSSRGTDRFGSEETVVIAEADDTGIGIPEDKLPKIFDPFFTTKPTGKGTGLGLAVTKSIVELHRGMIDVNNRPGGGVRVTIAFRTGGGEANGKETHPDH
jgi:PAS domain S-box-containing protein